MTNLNAQLDAVADQLQEMVKHYDARVLAAAMLVQSSRLYQALNALGIEKAEHIVEIFDVNRDFALLELPTAPVVADLPEDEKEERGTLQ